MLHGVDMTVDNNPFEAGLDRFVYLDSPGYVAAGPLRRLRDQGTPRVIVGFRMLERAIPRHGYAIYPGRQADSSTRQSSDGGDPRRPAGVVTSGTHSPTLDADIGMGYVDRALASPGTGLEIDVRGRLAAAETVPLPFYSRRRS
jgi:aminomethyltransferase